MTCIKLAITAYHSTHTPGSELLGYASLGGCSIHLSVIAIHLDRNYRSWVRIRMLGTAALVMAGMFSFNHGMFNHGMIIPKDHAWHSIVVHTANICVFFLEATLFVRSQVNNDVGNKKLLCGLLIILIDTFANIYRFVDSLLKTHSPWDAEKLLNLLGIGLSVLIGIGQIVCIAFNVYANTRRVSSGQEEQAATAAMWGNGGSDAGEQVKDEGAEVGNGLPVTIRASQVGWTAYTAGIKFKVIEWFKKAPGVSAVEEEQARCAVAAMEDNGGGDAGQQVPDGLASWVDGWMVTDSQPFHRIFYGSCVVIIN